MIVLNDFKKQWNAIQASTLNAVNRVGESGWLILGKEVEQFEQTIAATLQVKHAIGCANGLEALQISLRCLNIQPGDKVLTTPLSAFATTLAILNVGAIPVFVDVDQSGLIDLTLCEQVLQQHAIQWILPVHLYGQAVDLVHLAHLKNTYGIKVIEDCAQAILARSAGQPVGSVGDLSALSLYPTKNLGCLGDGGVVLTHCDELAAHARALRDYGQSEKYVHNYIGYNSRLDELQAAILNDALMPHLPLLTQKRINIARQYSKSINNPHIKLLNIAPQCESVWHIFPILVSPPDLRTPFQNYMQSAGIQTAIHYPLLITEQKAVQTLKDPIEILTPLPNAQRFAKQQISLPIHPFLTDQEIEHIITLCNQWQP